MKGFLLVLQKWSLLRKTKNKLLKHVCKNILRDVDEKAISQY